MIGPKVSTIQLSSTDSASTRGRGTRNGLAPRLPLPATPEHTESVG